MSIKNIPELLNAGVITQETADRILDYYKNKKGSSTSRLFIVFGILGAILIGLGIILIIAHNWDDLSRSTKTVIAFLPLVLGQIFCAISLTKKLNSIAWKESSTAFLFFSVGASISLVSQIYNIPGNLSSFILSWMLLCLPLLYVMNSSIASLLYLIGITFYAVEVGYTYPYSESYLYWILLLPAIPHYIFLYKKNPNSNFTTFHNWFVPTSILVALGTVANNMEELMFVAYISVLGLFYLIGDSKHFSGLKPINNSYRVLGSLGTILLLIILSFYWFWEDLIDKQYEFNEVIVSAEFLATSIITLLAIGLLYYNQKNKSIKEIKPLAPVFIVFILIFIIGLKYTASFALVNFYVFLIGILIIKSGAKQDSLTLLNFGLFIIASLIICRFFDTELSFVVRGILFVLVGTGFFFTNYWMLKKRKTNE